MLVDIVVPIIEGLVEAARAKGIRMPKNVRKLTANEIKVAKTVFKDTVAYGHVLLSDGAGMDGREFTLPLGEDVTTLGTITTPHGGVPRSFIVNVGGGYPDMYLRKNRSTLIHELTHVWQGMRSGLTWEVQVDSVLQQLMVGQDRAYDYDRNNLGDWGDYHVEQQAKIVEDWYVEASRYHKDDDDIDGEDDPRYRFIVANIRGEVYAPMPRATVDEAQERARYVGYETAPPVTEAYLISVLEQRFGANDYAGAGARVRKLESIFKKLSMAVAIPLLARLSAHRSGDKLSDAFYGALSPASQTKLIAVLQDRVRSAS